VTIKDKTLPLGITVVDSSWKSDWVVSKMNTGEIRFLSF
jgi:hypothetical protein